MRELFAAAAVVAVLVGGAFLLPVSYNAPAPTAPQRTAETSIPVPANNLVERPAVQNRTTAPESAVHPHVQPSSAPIAASRPQTTAQAEPAAGSAGQPAGNLQAGRQVYRKCQACHS